MVVREAEVEGEGEGEGESERERERAVSNKHLRDNETHIDIE